MKGHDQKPNCPKGFQVTSTAIRFTDFQTEDSDLNAATEPGEKLILLRL